MLYAELTVTVDVEGLVVAVEQAAQALRSSHGRPVAGEYVPVELQVRREVSQLALPGEKQHPLLPVTETQ